MSLQGLTEHQYTILSGLSNGLIGLNFQIGLKNIVLNIITGKFPAQKKVLTREHWIELANAFGLANQTFSNEDHFKAALVQAIRRALGLPPATSWNDSDLLQPLVNTALNSSASPNPVIPSPVPVIPQSQIPPPSFVPYSPSISPQSYSPSFSPSPNQTPNLPNQYLPPSYSPSNTSPSASPNTSPSPTPYQDNMTMSDSPAYSDQSFDYSSDSSPGSSVADQTLAERIKWWKRLEKTPSKIRHNLKLWNSSRDKRPFINMYLLYGGLSEAAGKKLTIKELIEEIVRLIKEWRQERKKYFREKKYGKDSPKGKKNKKNKKKDKKKDKKKKKSDSKKDKKKSKKDKKKDKKKKKSVSFDDSTIPAEFLVKKNRQKPSWTSGSINSLKLHASRNPTYTRNRVRLRPDLVGFASNEGKAHWSDPATFVPDYVRSQIKCAKSRGAPPYDSMAPYEVLSKSNKIDSPDLDDIGCDGQSYHPYKDKSGKIKWKRVPVDQVTIPADVGQSNKQGLVHPNEYFFPVPDPVIDPLKRART